MYYWMRACILSQGIDKKLILFPKTSNQKEETMHGRICTPGSRPPRKQRPVTNFATADEIPRLCFSNHTCLQRIRLSPLVNKPNVHKDAESMRYAFSSQAGQEQGYGRLEYPQSLRLEVLHCSFGAMLERACAYLKSKSSAGPEAVAMNMRWFRGVRCGSPRIHIGVPSCYNKTVPGQVPVEGKESAAFCHETGLVRLRDGCGASGK